MENYDQKIQLPLNLIAKIWWAWIWRTFVFTILLGLPVSLILLFLEQAFGLSKSETDLYAKAIIYLGSFIISIICLREALKLKYGNYEITILKKS
jgi:hypothetical protein